MKIYKKIGAAFIVTLLAVSPMCNARADEVAPQQIRTFSGGIGDGGMDEIAAAQQNYSLKLIFATTGGEYLADIAVEIVDRTGETILKATSQDSILLIQLPTGSYTVKATSDGETKAHKVLIRSHGLVTYNFHFTAKDS